MDTKTIQTALIGNFPHETTNDQQTLFGKIALFLDKENHSELFVLRGYAGTGKTSAIGTLVKCLPMCGYETFLLAPTGRAAKVLTEYSKKQAFTIHKKIYRSISNEETSRFMVQPNFHKNTVFIVDEASMIGNSSTSSGFYNERSLLDDLIGYVFSGTNCKLLLSGDTAQLPPVGLSESPALDMEYLKENYNKEISGFELKEVVRQSEKSGILSIATHLRKQASESSTENLKFQLKNFSDVIRINGTELEDALNSAYSSYEAENAIVICRSNKRANIFNQQIRARILWKENEISAGDQMMVVKNNYTWLPVNSKAGFIANGDTVELLKVKTIAEMHGFRFADVSIQLNDYPDEPVMEVKILLDTIMSESPALSSADNKKLYDSVVASYMDVANKQMRRKLVKNDPYLNALQVKFAYAVTCNKSQGGQWKTVFVEQGYLTKEMINTDYLRWLYTGFTRATEKLFLVNFNADFFEEP
ncbi:MAG: AAA family ATPase [Bacteroidia bacterium]